MTKTVLNSKQIAPNGASITMAMLIRAVCRYLAVPGRNKVLPAFFRRFSTDHDQQKAFLQEYKIRSSLERLIHYYANQSLPRISVRGLYDQSRKLSPEYILQNAQETVEHLLIYNARRLNAFRNLPYLVMLNPAISDLYNTYLQTMSALISALLNAPTTLQENTAFKQNTLDLFVDVHADTLPGLSKGFNEVIHLVRVDQIKAFLDAHLKERISMRLIVHQHIQLTDSVNGNYERGGHYNGVIKPLNIHSVIRKNAELINDLFLIKYDQLVPVTIDTNLYPPSYWSRRDPDTRTPLETAPNGEVVFPYIEYHLDYVLQEVFKNLFRAHIENSVLDPVQVTISTSQSPSYLEMRIRDKGKGMTPATLAKVFDYSFLTFESGEGESYKTLNVPPGLGGNTVAGMGYGLPLLKNYVEIFNGGQQEEEREMGAASDPTVYGLLSVQSYYGWGTDLYLKTVGADP